MDAILRARAARRDGQRDGHPLRRQDIIARARHLRHRRGSQPAESRQILPKGESRGILLYDTSGIHKHPTRTDIKVLPVNAMGATLELGNSKAYNMVVMGALLEAMPHKLPMENVMKGLKKSIPERHHNLLPSTARQ